MIKNNKQLARAKERVSEFKKTLDEAIAKLSPQDVAIYKKVHFPLINSIEKEINEYERLVLVESSSEKPRFSDPFEIGCWIIRERIRRGIPQSKLGEKLHISQEQVSRYEDNEYRNLTFLRVWDILKVFGYPLCEFNGFENNRERSDFKKQELFEDSANTSRTFTITAGSMPIQRVGVYA